jgi:hypothetical protein
VLGPYSINEVVDIYSVRRSLLRAHVPEIVSKQIFDDVLADLFIALRVLAARIYSLELGL